MDDGLIRLAAMQVAGIGVALVVFWLARRRPRAAGVLIGSAVMIAFGLIWLGAFLSEDHFEAGRLCFQVGFLGVLYGLPAPVLFQSGRGTGPFVSPGRAPEWVKAVGSYLGAWWVSAFVVGAIAMLGMAQAGQMR